MIDGVLQVKWDDWSNEDLFVEQGDAFMSAEAATIRPAGIALDRTISAEPRGVC